MEEVAAKIKPDSILSLDDLGLLDDMPNGLTSGKMPL